MRRESSVLIIVITTVLLGSADAGSAQVPPWEKGKPQRQENTNLPRDPVWDAAAAASRIEPKLDAVAPKDLTFTDDQGRQVAFGEYFTGDQPVVMTMTYFSCPMLCGQVMQGLVNSLGELDWRPGYDFKIINVSIDPRDAPERAATRKQSHLDIYGRGDETVAAGWHYLTGAEKEIRALADTVGYGYRWDDARQEYAHGAGLFVFTPEGRLSRVLPSIDYSEGIRPALLEAGDGKIGTLQDQLYFMMCWRWDPETGKYVNIAMNLMRFAGLLMVLAVAGLIVFLNRGASVARRADDEAQPLETKLEREARTAQAADAATSAAETSAPQQQVGKQP